MDYYASISLDASRSDARRLTLMKKVFGRIEIPEADFRSHTED